MDGGGGTWAEDKEGGEGAPGRLLHGRVGARIWDKRQEDVYRNECVGTSDAVGVSHSWGRPAAMGEEVGCVQGAGGTLHCGTVVASVHSLQLSNAEWKLRWPHTQRPSPKSQSAKNVFHLVVEWTAVEVALAVCWQR